MAVVPVLEGDDAEKSFGGRESKPGGAKAVFGAIVTGFSMSTHHRCEDMGCSFPTQGKNLTEEERRFTAESVSGVCVRHRWL